MPLFKRRAAPAVEPEPEPEPLVKRRTLLSEDELRACLYAELHVRDEQDAKPLVLVCLTPQLLPGQDLPEPELRAALSAMDRHTRPTDAIGRLGIEHFLVVLSETRQKPGQIVAHRLATELTVQSARFNLRKWLAGYATFPEDGASVEQLIEKAVTAARSRPLRAA